MSSTKRMLLYVRQYVIVAVYDIMDRDGIKYENDKRGVISTFVMYI